MSTPFYLLISSHLDSLLFRELNADAMNEKVVLSSLQP